MVIKERRQMSGKRYPEEFKLVTIHECLWLADAFNSDFLIAFMRILLRRALNKVMPKVLVIDI